jgi:ABC-type multidrug transport system ATPase subunit
MKAEFIIKNYRCFEDGHPLRFILEDGFTAFVGPNNCGKSSILKFFHEFRIFWSYLTGPTGNIQNLLAGRTVPLNFQSVIDQSEIFCDSNNRDILIEIDLDRLDHINSPQISKVVFYISKSTTITVKAEFYADGNFIDYTKNEFKFKDNKLNISEKYDVDFSPFFEIFNSLHRSVYYPSFRNLINVGAGSYFDINIGTSFISQWHEWSVGSNKNANNVIKKVIENIRGIFRYEQLEILSSTQNLNTLQIYIDGKSYKLQEIGSGIAQFILVLGNAALNQPSFIMIDEPELNLHPSLQLDFLTALTSYSKNGILFATHSIGLARAIADKIYSVRKDGKRSILSKFEQTGNLSEFLGELSFSSFRELGFDKILLVEGVNEVKTIQQFLRLLKKDHEIVILPLGGNQMINGGVEHELSEIKRISNNVFALIDSEKEAKDLKLSSEREAFRKICENLDIKTHVLERRAIENYFTDNAIKAVKGDKYKALGSFEKLEKSPMPWAKGENWRIAHKMILDDIEETDLLNFLKQL